MYDPRDPRYNGSAYGVPSSAFVGGGAPQGQGASFGNGSGGDPHPAVIQMPRVADLGGKTAGVVPWVRYPYYPTAPFYSTDPYVGYQTRFYSAGLVSSDTDYVQGSESIRTVQFDIPCRLIAFTGAAFNTSAAGGYALPVGVGPRDCWLFRAEYTTGDKLHVTQRLASSVVGTMERPGELGGTGWTIDQGASLVLGFTPLLPNLRIDLTLVCLEMRGPRNYSPR